MENKKLIWGFIFSLLLISFAVFAQEGPISNEEGQQMRGERPMRMMEGRGQGRCEELIHQQLGLTDKQSEKLKEIKIANMKENHKIMQKLQNYKHLLKVEMMEDDPDVSEIKGLAKKIGKLEEEKIVNKAEQLNKLKAILTKDQYKKLNFQMMFRKGRHKGRSGRRGNRSR